MSSIIVLDSSDEEDEAPAKQPCLSRPIPATITTIKTTTVAGGTSALVNAKLMKERKSRTIPSGITVTRHSPVPVVMTKIAAPNTSSSSGSSLSVAAGITSTMLAKTISNIAKPLQPILPKINAAYTKSSSRGSSPNENQRQRTSTPPVAASAAVTAASATKQQPQFQMMPQLQPSPQMRKRKTPTPPQQQRHLHTPPTLTSGAPATVAANSTTTATLVPIISSVQSMSAASSTPPLQLLATPPHAAASTFNEQQLMISPKLVHNQSTNLTASTAIPTAAMQSSNNMNSNSSSFKIQLPPKRGANAATTSSPMASPVLKSPSLVLPNPMLKSILSSNTTTVSAQYQSEKVVRRIKPTTVLKHNDEAWMLQRQQQQQQQQRTAMSHRSLGDDVRMEFFPSTSSSNSPKPPTPTSTPPDSHMSITISPKPPQLIHQKRNASSTNVDVDLTDSPEKSNTIINLAESPPTYTKTNSPSGASPKLNGESKNDENVVCVNLDDSTAATDVDEPADVNKRPPLEPEYDELIKACRIAESSDDMEKLINTKLVKYYYDVHPDFVKSRGFRKTVRTVTERIRADPELVYYNLKTIVDELKVRRKSKAVVMNNEELSAGGSSSAVGSTGNKRTDEQIKKLNKALYILTKRIEKLEEAEVDWDEDDSSYLQVERSKKRACQIYEKICDLTGESKNAHRLVKKPIQFNGTSFTQFNKTLQAFINRTKEFPDYYDVMRMLEHCNRQYSLGLTIFEMKRVAQDAFIKVGKLLQSRRKTDLYETVTHFTANSKDPATTDPTLLAKLSENQKNQTKISEIIEKYAREQDFGAEEQKEARLQEKLKTSADESAAVNDNDVGDDSDGIAVKTETNSKDTENNNDDEEDEDSDTDDGSDIEQHVENLANGDLSDAESDNETHLTTATNKSRDEKDNSTETIIDISETETTTKTIFNNNNNNNKNDKERTIATAAVVAKTTRNEELEKTASKVCDKQTTKTTATTTVNNNVTTRIKTGDMVDHRTVVDITKQSQQQQQQQQIPNGKLKDVTDVTASTSLKIVSVSSLCANIKQIDGSNINNSRSNISNSNKQNISSQNKVTAQQQHRQQQSATVNMAARTTTSSPPIVATTVAQKLITKTQSQQQRTLAEIVISDEET